MELAGWGWGAVVELGGWTRRWHLIVGSGEWRCTKAPPTSLTFFGPAEKTMTSLPDVGRGKALCWLKSSLFGSEGRLSGSESPPTSRLGVGKVCGGYGFRSEEMLSIWRPQVRVQVEPHSLAIG